MGQNHRWLLHLNFGKTAGKTIDVNGHWSVWGKSLTSCIDWMTQNLVNCLSRMIWIGNKIWQIFSETVLQLEIGLEWDKLLLFSLPVWQNFMAAPLSKKMWSFQTKIVQTCACRNAQLLSWRSGVLFARSGWGQTMGFVFKIWGQNVVSGELFSSGTTSEELGIWGGCLRQSHCVPRNPKFFPKEGGSLEGGSRAV